MTKTSCARLTDEPPSTNVGALGITRDNERHRVLVPQALGSDEFLRVTWHATRDLIVFSYWDGDHCVAATPVRVTDIGELAGPGGRWLSEMKIPKSGKEYAIMNVLRVLVCVD